MAPRSWGRYPPGQTELCSGHTRTECNELSYVGDPCQGHQAVRGNAGTGTRELGGMHHQWGTLESIAWGDWGEHI